MRYKNILDRYAAHTELGLFYDHNKKTWCTQDAWAGQSLGNGYTKPSYICNCGSLPAVADFMIPEELTGEYTMLELHS